MSNTSSANPGIKWGLITGLIMVAISVIIWVVNRDLMFSFWLGGILFVVCIILAVQAGLEKRKQLGGYIEFKQALQPVFLTFVIGGLIGAIYTYLAYNVIDPTLPDQLKHHTMETTEKIFHRLGMPQDKIDEQLDKINEQEFKMGFVKSLTSYIYSLIFYFIVAAIIALIIRKKKPVDFNTSVDEIGKQP